MASFWLINGVDPGCLLTGMILQVVLRVNGRGGWFLGVENEGGKVLKVPKCHVSPKNSPSYYSKGFWSPPSSPNKAGYWGQLFHALNVALGWGTLRFSWLIPSVRTITALSQACCPSFVNSWDEILLAVSIWKKMANLYICTFWFSRELSNLCFFWRLSPSQTNCFSISQRLGKFVCQKFQGEI